MGLLSTIARRIRRGFAGGVLSEIVAAYSPDILLDFNQPEGSGSTIPDVSGNGRDFTADGTEGVDFTWKGSTGHLSGTPGRIELIGGASWTSDAEFAGDHCWVFGAKCDMTGTAGYPFDIASTRFLLRGATGLIGYAGASSDTTPYDAAQDNEFLYSVRRNGTSLALLVNGLTVFESPTVALTFVNGTEWAIAQRISTGGNTASGDYDGFFFYKNADLTAAEIYDIAQRAGAVPEAGHWFKETLTDDVGLAHVCDFHAPTWEIDGADVMDVSGNGRHGAYINGPTLGEDPIGDDAIYSVGMISNQYIDAVPTTDIRDGFTFVIRFNSDSESSNRNILEIRDGTGKNLAFAYRNAPDNDLYLVANDGTSSGTFIFSDLETPVGQDSYACLTFDGDTVKAWLNGAKSVTEVDLSAYTFPDWTAEDWWIGAAFGLSGLSGTVGLPTVLNRAVNEAQALRLSGGAALDAYPTVDLKAGTNITGTSPVTAWSSDVGEVDVASFSGSPDRSAGGGLELNGSTQYAVLDGTTDNFRAITETGRFAWGARVRIDDLTTGPQCVHQTKGPDRGIYAGITGAGDLAFRVFNGSNVEMWAHSEAPATLDISDGVEFEWIVTSDGTNSRQYIDGVLISTVAVSTEAGTHNFAGYLGRLTNLASGHLDGAINGLFFEPTDRPLATIQGALNA